MKIQKFNEKISDDFVYKGTMTIEFEIDKSYVDSYANIFSDNEIKKLGIKGLLDKYLYLNIDPDKIKITKLFPSGSSFNKLDKSIEFELYDNDGNLIGDEVYRDSKNFNL